MGSSDLGSGCAKATTSFSALEQVCEEQQVDTAILCPKASPSLLLLMKSGNYSNSSCSFVNLLLSFLIA